MIPAIRSAAIASALGETGANEQQADEHGERAGHVAGEVKSVGAQSGAAVLAGGAEGDDGPAEIDDERDGNDKEDVPAGIGRDTAAKEMSRPPRR